MGTEDCFVGRNLTVAVLARDHGHPSREPHELGLACSRQKYNSEDVEGSSARGEVEVGVGLAENLMRRPVRLLASIRAVDGTSAAQQRLVWTLWLRADAAKTGQLRAWYGDERSQIER